MGLLSFGDDMDEGEGEGNGEISGDVFFKKKKKVKSIKEKEAEKLRRFEEMEADLLENAETAQKEVDMAALRSKFAASASDESKERKEAKNYDAEMRKKALDTHRKPGQFSV